MTFLNINATSQRNQARKALEQLNSMCFKLAAAIHTENDTHGCTERFLALQVHLQRRCAAREAFLTEHKHQLT